MPWEPDFIEDGDAANAAGVNAILDDAQAWVNDIGRAGIRRGAFNHFFPPVTGLLPAAGSYTNDEVNAIWTYVKATFAPSMTYTTYGADGGSDSGGAGLTGDRSIIGHPLTGSINPCQLTLPGSGFKVGMDNGDRVGAILCLLNVEVEDFTVGGAMGHFWAMFCIQFQLNGAGTWYTIDSSERFVSLLNSKLDTSSGPENTNIDIPIACLITEEMVEAVGTASADEVTAIRGMTSMYSDGDGTESLTLGYWNITALPLHCRYTEV